MSRTGMQIINTIDQISTHTGYPFKFLMEQYFAIVNELERIDGRDDPIELLEQRAGAGEWVLPDEYKEQTHDPKKPSKFKINVDTTSLLKGRDQLRECRDGLRHISGLTSVCLSDAPPLIKVFDPETTKIRKHTHDTLWAVMLGFAACAGLVIVIGLIIIGVLSYARG